ncbi:hypothetical protein [Paenibacillus luteus]|uniref:hypothetical protein n=1 Tax=Paenibacillus luteus TaxID=2545753 RepID=UPI001144E0C8|nr:hypothetical protein [Paenibacillus luteus]
MKKIIFVLAAFTLLTACGNNYENALVSTQVVYSVPGMESFVNARDVADKTPEEVVSILGEPLFSETFDFAMGPDKMKTPVTKNYYSAMLDDEEGAEVGRVEILFAKNGARWIRVNFISGEYSKDDRSAMLTSVGIEPIELDEAGQLSATGRGVDGYHRVEVHDVGPGGNGTVLVVTQGEYE